MDFKSYAQSKQTVIFLELERVSMLLELAGSPDKGLKIIHIAGTNGKGSVGAIIGCGLVNAGFTTGRFLSPELFDVTDTIKVNEADIKKEELFSIYEFLKPLCDEVEQKTGKAVSQFEINFVAAMVHFKNNNCTYAVLECGMGGKGDATNAVCDNAVSVITPISYDHTSFLGDTLEEITRNKCGIFKKSTVVVTGFQKEAVMEEIKKEAGGRRLIYALMPEINGYDGFEEIFSYGELKSLKCSLCGIHQVKNAAIAIEVLKLLGCSDDHIRFAVSHAKNPARLERLADGVYFDGGHNPDGVKSLVNSLNRYAVGKKIIFVAGMMADKDISGIFDCLKELDNKNFEIYTCTVHSNPRSAGGEHLAEIATQKGFVAKAFSDVNSACINAEGRCDLLIVFGSLYMYKECTVYQGEKKP